MVELTKYKEALKNYYNRHNTINSNLPSRRIVLYEKEPPYNDMVKVADLQICSRFYKEFREDMKKYPNIRYVTSDAPILFENSFLG